MKKIFTIIILLLISLISVGSGIVNFVENRIIINEYGKLDDGIFNENDPQSITMKLGKYNGYIAVFFYKDINREIIPEIIDTNSLYFYSNEGMFYLYKDKQFYSFQEVTDNNLITKKDLYYLQYNFDIYRYTQFILFGNEL